MANSQYTAGLRPAQVAAINRILTSRGVRTRHNRETGPSTGWFLFRSPSTGMYPKIVKLRWRDADGKLVHEYDLSGVR